VLKTVDAVDEKQNRHETCFKISTLTLLTVFSSCTFSLQYYPEFLKVSSDFSWSS
jgi:hypothetical protein